MKLLTENPKELARSIREVFWNQRLTPAQALEINRILQGIPDRLMSDSEHKTVFTRLMTTGLTDEEAEDVISLHQDPYQQQRDFDNMTLGDFE